ncbi:Acetoacetyl-CoA synthetase [Fasciola gigantica]|uniref:Acetoacetyl-CoA synthetase n=1 Tax=Fasciola gigantica TaxID=46835 RepID=A0A504YQC1_FASGI|nr:Acetoacetyl-CoA synthetase [Fasciola gigantica]
MVLCVTAGNIAGLDEPWILALCADSHCYAFDATYTEKSNTIHSFEPRSPSNKDKGQPQVLKMVHHQHLAYNAKDICLVNTENSCDIAVAHSDRVVRLYTWCPVDPAASSECYRGKFVILIKWELAGQVNRVDTHQTLKWGTLLVASQPGGAFAVLQRKFEKYKDNLAPTLVYYPPRVGNTRNMEARTWIVGNVRSRQSASRASEKNSFIGTDSSSVLAVCMADGTVIFIDPTADEDMHRVIWCIQLRVRGELFALSKVNLTGGDTDEVCVCAWDGTTFVLNHRKEWFRFPMGQSCQAFTAGWYAVEPGHNEPVFVYTTCEHSLLIYYNLNVKNIVEPSLSGAIVADKELADQIREKMNVVQQMPQALWIPNEYFARQTFMYDFMQFVERRCRNKVHFSGDYHRLYAWSIADLNEFWMAVFDYCGAIDSAVPMDSKPAWFPGCLTSYTENVLRGGQPDDIALYSCRLLPNCIEAVICYLATSSIGAIWSSASPDFGVQSVIQRLDMVKPTVLFAVTRTVYRGKMFDQSEKVRDIVRALVPKPVRVVFIPFLELFHSAITLDGDSVVETPPDGNCTNSRSVQVISGQLYLRCRDQVDGKLRPVINFVPNRVTTIGTSAKWLAVCEERNLKPGSQYSLKHLRSILSTGSPLAPRSFDYVYREIKSDLMLGSISGGTDMIGCCVGCCPLLPVYRGQIQCRLLGMVVESWDERGESHVDRKGELVIARPFPSMPVGFWNDPDDARYHEAYFSKFSHIWSHGDFLELHSETEGLTISGRSDATLNPSGVRFGSAEIYNLIEGLPDVSDSLCVAQSNAEYTDERVILLIKLSNSSVTEGPLPDDVALNIRKAIRSQLSPRFVPSVMLSVSAIPYTLNGKKVELAVRRLFEGHPPEEAFSKESLIDPSVVPLYVKIAQKLYPWS